MKIAIGLYEAWGEKIQFDKELRRVKMGREDTSTLVS